MTTTSYSKLREIILDIIAPKLKRIGIDRLSFDDDTDLLAASILDSFDYFDMILELEEKCCIEIDFVALDTEPIDTMRGLINSILKQMDQQ